MSASKDIIEILLEAGLVSNQELEEAKKRSEGSGRRLVDELLSMAVLNEAQLTQALSNALSIPWVSLTHVEFSRTLLDLVPATVAMELEVVPVYVRRVGTQGDTLFVATIDPTDQEALTRLAAATGKPVKAMIAPPSELREALRRCYAPAAEGKNQDEANTSKAGEGGTTLPGVSWSGENTLPSAEIHRLPEPPPAPVSTANEHETRKSAPRSPPPPPPSAEALKTPPSERPPQRVKANPRRSKKKVGANSATLTLLDGTVIRLPVPNSEGSESEAEATQRLSAGDILSALMARTRGADVSDVLPDDRWEGLFASLLSLLLRKGLISDQEFIDEVRRRWLAEEKDPQP